MSQVKPIPDGFHTATPYLTVRGADRAIDFYQRAFGAKERFRMAGPDGKIVHAEIRIGDSIVMLSEEMPEWGSVSPLTLNGTGSSVFLYDADVDALYSRAVAAGAKAVMPPQDQFWGDRFGKLTDPFGHSWALATHKEDVSPAEMEKRHQAFIAEMAKQRPQ